MLVRTLSFTFDAASYTYSYDALDRVTSEGQSIQNLPLVVQYQSKYDSASRRTELQAVVGSTNDFQNTYTYDNLGRVTRLQQQDVTGGNSVADKRVDFAYDASGVLTRIDRYADQTTSEHVVSTGEQKGSGLID
jgi:YD repeat-containing protein